MRLPSIRLLVNAMSDILPRPIRMRHKMPKCRYFISLIAFTSVVVIALFTLARSDQESPDLRGSVYDQTPTGVIRNEDISTLPSEQFGETRPLLAQAQQKPAAQRQQTPAVRSAAPAQPAPPTPQPQPGKPDQSQDPNGPQLVEMFGEWKLQCFGRPVQRCELQQRRIDPRTQTTIFWVEISRTPNASDDTITIITPLGMKVLAGINFSIDGQFSQALQPQTCVQFGCLSQLKANRVFQQKLLQSKQLKATVTSLAGQKVTFEMPADGISEGYSRMFALTNTQ